MRDGTGDDEADWKAARERTGADYLTHSPVQMDVDSPFDYAANSRVLIINDVNKNDMDQVASAYRALFEAADGGALGLFTAIQRLRAVHEIIAGPMERGGYSIYAQHADQINTGTLVDIFREDTHACLLGTDAVRDGIDVPGESLRLLVYDRVPWPRPTILHKARRERFGGRRYDEMLTRLRLRQAFGRLIRSTSDRGVFVMLDSLLPSRLLGAFPEGANVQRAGLAEAVLEVKSFL
jgi:ATP-dependent DNA helicase DinG